MTEEEVQFSVKVPKQLRDDFKHKYPHRMTDAMILLMRRNLYGDAQIKDPDATIAFEMLMNDDPLGIEELQLVVKALSVRIVKIHEIIKSLTG